MDLRWMPALPGRLHACRGFTLLELLIVLVIMGVLVGLAVINVAGNDPDRVLAYEAQRLQQCLRLGGEEAIENGQILGLRLEADGYGFLRYDGRQWAQLADPPCRPHRWPGWVDMQLALEGQQPSLSSSQAAPQLWLLPGGEATSFSVELAGGGVRYRVQGDLLGRLQMERLTS